MQSTKRCKEVTFDCRKITLSHLKGQNHWGHHAGKVTKAWRNENLNPRQKKQLDPSIFLE